MLMREIWKPAMLSAAVLLLSSPATQAGNPREESNAQHQVRTAVGFVEDLAAGKPIEALFSLYPHLQDKSSNPDVPLTDQEDEIGRRLRELAVPLFRGCKIEKGWVLDGLKVRLTFEEPCGDQQAYGVDVQLTLTGEKFHPSGFTLLTNEVL